jgi:hypothetical protein
LGAVSWTIENRPNTTYRHNSNNLRYTLLGWLQVPTTLYAAGAYAVPVIGVGRSILIFASLCFENSATPDKISGPMLSRNVGYFRFEPTRSRIVIAV